MTQSSTPREEDNPIWALLGVGNQSDSALWIVPARRPWRQTLDEAVDGVAPGHRLVVSVPRPLGRSILARLSGRGTDRRSGPTPRQVEQVLTTHGLTVEAGYGLWPSARSPRIAFPRGRFHMLYWLQTTGVLGGGGNRLWARRLARSLLFTPLLPVILPGVAMVARRPDGPRAP